MPKHSRAQTEQTNSNTNQQQDNQQPTGEPSATAADSQAETTNTEPLISSMCPWTRHANSTEAKASITQWELQITRRTASGLHGVLRVLDAHRDAVANEEQPLLNDNIEGALFDAATQLVSDLEHRLDRWAEKAGEA